MSAAEEPGLTEHPGPTEELDETEESSLSEGSTLGLSEAASEEGHDISPPAAEGLEPETGEGSWMTSEPDASHPVSVAESESSSEAGVVETDSDAADVAASDSGDGTTEHAEETEGAAPTEDWSAEPAFETSAETAPDPQADPSNPAVSSDDDHDALAGLGALAAGAVGAAISEDSPWTTETSSGTSESSSSYRPPAAPAPPKRDLVKLLLISYAVLATVAGGLLWKRLNDRTVNEDRLENLPDVRPPKAVGQVSTFDANISLPPGHLLKLGEKRRFGNIEVEPTRITRGMVSYEHPAGERWTLLPEGPVVKLWLRFRNVSKDQAIPPLDKYLVFSKAKIAGTEHFRTNNVLTTAEGRRPFGYILTHDHADKNILKGQELDHEIPPGGTLETFIPSAPELDLPSGELLWRVHLRKGFGKAGAGVTTLIEVAFSAKDVVEDGQG